MRMGLEALESGELLARRPDAAELSAIRDGALTFDELFSAALRLQGEMERAAAATKLPRDINHSRVSQLAVELMMG